MGTARTLMGVVKLMKNGVGVGYLLESDITHDPIDLLAQKHKNVIYTMLWIMCNIRLQEISDSRNYLTPSINCHN